MMIFLCDRCKKNIWDTSHFHMTFSGGVNVDLCEECEAQFRTWLGNADEPDEVSEEHRCITSNSPKMYYADFGGKQGFREYKILADTDTDAKRIALAYDNGKTESGDKLNIYYNNMVVIHEVIE